MFNNTWCNKCGYSTYIEKHEICTLYHNCPNCNSIASLLEIDTSFILIINHLNNKGVNTRFCCEGVHSVTSKFIKNNLDVYLMFDFDIKGRQLHQHLTKFLHEDPYGIIYNICDLEMRNLPPRITIRYNGYNIFERSDEYEYYNKNLIGHESHITKNRDARNESNVADFIKKRTFFYDALLSF